MTILAKWRGDGLTPGAWAADSTAGTGDTPMSSAGTVLSVDGSGPRSPRIKVAAETGATAYVFWGPAHLGKTLSAAAVRFYVEFTGIASASWMLLSGWSGTTLNWKVDISGAGGSPPGQVRLRKGDNTQIASSTVGLPLNTVVRIELLLAADGTMSVYAYEGDSTTALFVVTGQLGFTPSYDIVRFGYNGVSPVVPAYYLDDLMVSDSPVLIGPEVKPPAPSVGWFLWDGTNEVPLNLEGVFDGAGIVPVTLDTLT
ncbi:hypothetical protein ACFVH6_25655 [Spirillospora sp. NPDC127200]